MKTAAEIAGEFFVDTGETKSTNWKRLTAAIEARDAEYEQHHQMHQEQRRALQAQLDIARGLLERWTTPGYWEAHALLTDLAIETRAFLAGTPEPGRG